MPTTHEAKASTADLYIAIDLGAGSGRVFLIGFEPSHLIFEEISRFQYPPNFEDGHLRWDFDLIFNEIKLGLKSAHGRAENLDKSIRSLAVDSWAVDYGLIDDKGYLLSNPVCYRDARTLGVMDRVFALASRTAIFEKTGIQFLNFNTIYQLYSEGLQIEIASRMLLLPDLINFLLTGSVTAEYTNATTTQLFNAHSRDWDIELIERLALPASLFPKVIAAGTDLGLMKSEIAEDIGLSIAHVVATTSHDTASAIAGAPLEPGWAYISSGTWSLIGIERTDVLINDDVARQNFTNEGGAFGTIRFLKNVTGLWIFDSCRKEWKAKGIDVEYHLIIKDIAAVNDFSGFIFPDDERFLNPPSMLDAIALQMNETGQTFADDPVIVSKIIFDSLAFRYASILKSVVSLTGSKLNGVQIVGGGGRNEYLNQLTADATGLQVQAGLIEAAAMGNALVQAIAAGRFSSLANARSYVRKNIALSDYFPRHLPEMASAAKRYDEIENKFISHKAVTLDA